MTLATSAAPLNSERRDTSVSGTRAVFSSQQLMGASKHCREALRRPKIHRALTVRLGPQAPRCLSVPFDPNQAQLRVEDGVRAITATTRSDRPGLAGNRDRRLRRI